MSYCVLITRRTQNASAADITFAEWQAVVRADDALTADEDEQCARWNGVSSVQVPSLEWHAGEIFSHNPDTALLSKMRQLAAQLAARVVTEEGDDVTDVDEAPFKPETAYDYDFDESRRLIQRHTYGGVSGLLWYQLPAVTAIGGLLLVLTWAARFGVGWPCYAIGLLASGTVLAHLYCERQKSRANDFCDWLLRNVTAVVAGTARYRDTPINLETRVTRFSAAYSFGLSSSAWSRWYIVGEDSRSAKWLHCGISVLLGSWGVPLGPLGPAMALLINLKRPGGDDLSVRNLYLRIDDRLCEIVGNSDNRQISGDLGNGRHA